MSISVQIQSSNSILTLAKLILSDWSNKMAQQSLGTGKDKKFQYRVLLTEDNYKIDQNNSSQFDLLVLVKQLSFSVPHMLALSEQLSTFGQNENQFVPEFLAQIAIANCIAISVIQHFISSLLYFKPSNQSKLGKKDKKCTFFRISCIDCLKYYGAFNISAKATGIIGQKRGGNFLDGGAPFYSIYKTKKGLIAVGNLQPKFYSQMVEQLPISTQQKVFCLQNQLNTQYWPQIRKILTNVFLKHTAQEWEVIMKSRDTCVTQVKQKENLDQAFLHPNLIKPRM